MALRSFSGGAGRSAAGGGRRARAGLSLKGRALKFLAQREHSRVELRNKLGPHAESPEDVERVLDELEGRGFLSPQRFAESLAHRRADRFGLRRIEHELDAHRLDAAVSAPVIQKLKATERDRALAAWRKRFGVAATDAAGRAKQHRFLAQRGFAGEAIAWVLRHGATADDPSSGDDVSASLADDALASTRSVVDDDPSSSHDGVAPSLPAALGDELPDIDWPDADDDR